jgi:SAM-dependent methyltransferase
MSFSKTHCWCGGRALSQFNAEYARCPDCQTLICTNPPRQVDPRQADDSSALYGKDYWLKHQQQSYGLGDIHQRARTDLPERNLFWLNQLLKLKLPPGRALELGSAHGGFTFLLKQAGFDAVGLELSPAVCGIARRTFDVETFCGPVEEQPLEPRSLDVIAVMDVLEHLADPLGTLRHCTRLLTPDGLILIQTPKYPAGKSFGELAATQDRFLAHLNPLEHTYLFTRDGAARLLKAAGAPHVAFFPAIFGFYDMFLAASPAPLKPAPADLRDAWLGQTPQRRMIRALLDSEDRFRGLLAKYRDLQRNANGDTLYAAA